MKKQIIFYVIWDVLFFLFLYVFCKAESLRQEFLYRAQHPLTFIMAMSILNVAAGALIGWLAFVTWRYERTRKSAILEFVLVGGFGLYLSSLFLLYFLLPFKTVSSYLVPLWMIRDTTTPIILGGILFGYELCVFIVRMVQCHKQKKLADTE